MSYLVHKHGQQLGPFSEAELHQKLAAGELTPMDMAWKQGLPGWMPLKNVLPPEQAAVPVAVPPPLPMPPRAPSPVLSATAEPARDIPLRQPSPDPIPRQSPSSGHAGLDLLRNGGLGAAPVKRKRPIWPWVLGVAILAAFGVVFVAGMIVLKRVNKKMEAITIAEKSLFEDRAGHKPTWKKSSFEAVGPAEDPPKDKFEKVHYTSDAGPLVAYLTPDPKDGKKHPAIVWAHGGFGGIGSYFWDEASKYDDQSGRAFREAGIVMMAPSWRGENDNPGRFELFYGEVNDLLAAVKHVKSLPYVDPERVYIGGHSTGGTLTLLASTASGEFRAAFSFGGMPDGRDVLYQSDGFGNTPYNAFKERESLLRSPIRYTRFITRPTFYFEGEDNDAFVEAAQKMAKRATAAKVPFQAYTLPGNHFDILHPVTGLLAKKILADTGDSCNLSFTDAELRQAYDESFSNTLAKVLSRWNRDGGDLAKLLNDMEEEDGEPRTTQDVKEMKRTVAKLAQQPATPAITAQLATLTEYCDSVTDGDIYGALQKEVVPDFRDWAKKRLESDVPFATTRGGDEPAESAKFLQVLQYILQNDEDETVLPVVVQAAKKRVGLDDYTWSSMFRPFSDDAEMMTRLVKAFDGHLPEGIAGVALLDVANQARLEDEWKGTHPFDTADGVARLLTHLEARDPETYSHAHSAAVGMAFLSPENRARLLPVALQHPDHEVRLEAGWADLKSGGTTGLTVLQKASLDVHQSSTAKRYLKELNHEADIPAEAKVPEFAARAEMSQWLQHPNEIGTAPLTLEVHDQAELFWPPRQKKIPVWLFKFTYRFSSDAGDESKPVKTGYGMVGGMTWSFFDEETTAPTPGSLYVKHCALELEHAADDEDEDEDDAGSKGGAKPEKKKLTREQWQVEARKQLEKGNPGVSFE